MLLELHVKNLALIEAADVELEDGLNILTGETGAGKSIMIGSVNLALGQKASKEMIRNGAEYAYVELVFSVDPEKEEALRMLHRSEMAATLGQLSAGIAHELAVKATYEVF